MTANIPGAETVANWFGHWPSFHDAEILSVHLDRSGPSSIRVRAWITGQDTDVRGHFIRRREGVVVFEFRGIKYLRLEGEDADRQNVIAGLALEKTEEGYRLDLWPSYGLAGQLVVSELAVKLEQANPPV